MHVIFFFCHDFVNMIPVHEDIPSKILAYSSNCNIETLLVEINLRKRKRLLNGSYNPNKSQISHHLKCLNKRTDMLQVL